MKALIGAVIAVLVLVAGVLLTPVALVIGFLFMGGDQEDRHEVCHPGMETVEPPSVGSLPTVLGWDSEQVSIAAQIITAGAEREISTHGQTVAIMTAMGESSLENIDYGDWETSGVRNPDGSPTSSIGIFQEQHWHGTTEERLDPYLAAGRFYDRLQAVQGWESLEPTIAAHRAQRNRDPYHYEQWWQDAVRMIRALADSDLPELSEDPNAPCTDSSGEGGAREVGPNGWANPASGIIRSGFGIRPPPVPGVPAMHTGTDIAAECGTPIYAAADGVVAWAGLGPYQGRSGNGIVIDHTDQILTRYGHLLSGTLLVSTGDTVEAGQQIAQMGGDPLLDPVGAGNSTGCHLHFEVNVPDPVDPEEFFANVGVTLGAA